MSLASTITWDSAVEKLDKPSSAVMTPIKDADDDASAIVPARDVTNASAHHANTPKNDATNRYGLRCLPLMGNESETRPYRGCKLHGSAAVDNKPWIDGGSRRIVSFNRNWIDREESDRKP